MSKTEGCFYIPFLFLEIIVLPECKIEKYQAPFYIFHFAFLPFVYDNLLFIDSVCRCLLLLDILAPRTTQAHAIHYEINFKTGT